ncbi:uncharacterized protein EI90DRAFT_3025210 [Cantharellus anzutake]|uniref:uncharacterized protein n=1 Tax=Cantharellus anzutake TaxID=1750568 RepID=UPI0019086EBA|nr:uncharacterized protein EI90DRAFT_3025210 [Cantharellus anzutake]KAF8309381.1 hypothetical protein EI90DRAFT_3025210 [Cantharellus anzutake]
MIVWGMNGKALSPDHGFPLRVVIPGQIGGRSVKWLRSIVLHFFDNRILPTQVTAQQARDEKHWWYNRNYLISDLNVNSAIAQPSHDEILDLSKSTASRTKSHASGDLAGQRQVVEDQRHVTIPDPFRTEWPTDRNDDFRVYPEDLYRMVALESRYYGTLDLTERDTSFCWCFWKYTVSVDELSKSDVIMVRAMDQGLGIQPQDMYWTNWWFRVAVHHEVKDGADILRFEHPTLAGVTPGGWMEASMNHSLPKKNKKLTTSQRMKNTGLSPLTPEFSASKQKNNPVEPPKKPAPASMTNPEVNRVISMTEYFSLTRGEGKKPLFIVEGNVYDGTGFLDEHPGGADSIWLASGEADATEDFVAIHSDDARTKLRKFHIGKLQADGAEQSRDDSGGPSSVFLDRRKWKAAHLVKITSVSHDSFIYRFALPSPEQPLGLPVGQHVFVRLRRKTTGEVVQRAYTPVSQQDEHGHIDLLIKLYLPCAAFPLGGKMTVGFHELVVGDTVEFKGPLGSFVWEGKGNLRWRGVPRSGIRHLGLICGGSGITPILQVLRSVLHDDEDSETHLYLLDVNRTESDILCWGELDTWYELHGDKARDISRRRLKIHYTLSRPSPQWTFGTGRVNDGMLETHMPPPSDDAMVLVCGPGGMVDDAVKPGLERLGWDVSKALVVF